MPLQLPKRVVTLTEAAKCTYGDSYDVDIVDGAVLYEKWSSSVVLLLTYVYNVRVATLVLSSRRPESSNWPMPAKREGTRRSSTNPSESRWQIADWKKYLYAFNSTIFIILMEHLFSWKSPSDHCPLFLS